MLPQKVYEFLRWTLTIVVPAGLALFIGLNTWCGWGVNSEAVAGVVTSIATFLGAIFGISKVTNDKLNGK